MRIEHFCPRHSNITFELLSNPTLLTMLQDTECNWVFKTIHHKQGDNAIKMQGGATYGSSNADI